MGDMANDVFGSEEGQGGGDSFIGNLTTEYQEVLPPEQLQTLEVEEVVNEVQVVPYVPTIQELYFWDLNVGSASGEMVLISNVSEAGNCPDTLGGPAPGNA